MGIEAIAEPLDDRRVRLVIRTRRLAYGVRVRARGFVGTYSCLVAKRDHVVQRRVVRGRLFEPLHHGSQT